MTNMKNHPTVKGIKVKFMIEIALLILFLAVYHDFLDGATKPFWLNVLLVSSIVCYVANDFYGYATLLNPVQGNNIAKSLEGFRSKLRGILIGSMSTSIAFAISLILFLTFNIHFTVEKYAVLIGIVFTFGVMMYMSYKIWASRIGDIREALSGFRENG